MQKNLPVFLGWHSFIDYLKQLPNKRVCSFYAEKDWDDYYAKKNDVEYIKTLASIMVPADQGMDCVNSMVLQPRYRDYELSRKYVERIKRFAERKSPKDKSIFVFNKVDKIVPFFTKDSKVLFGEFRRNYPNVLSPFINVSPLGWFKGYKCRFAPFSSGNFQKTEKGEFFFHPGDDAYPKLLWKTICKSI